MGQWGSCLSARTGLASSLLGQLRREGQRASPGSSRGQRRREDAAAVEHRHGLAGKMGMEKWGSRKAGVKTSRNGVSSGLIMLKS